MLSDFLFIISLLFQYFVHILTKFNAFSTSWKTTLYFNTAWERHEACTTLIGHIHVALLSILVCFINLRCADSVCLHYGLRVCLQINSIQRFFFIGVYCTLKLGAKINAITRDCWTNLQIAISIKAVQIHPLSRSVRWTGWQGTVSGVHSKHKQTCLLMGASH